MEVILLKFGRKSGVLMITLVWVCFLSISPAFSQTSKWQAPEAANLMKPSIDLSDTSIIHEGQDLFTQLCAVCHGDKGKGDGIAGMALNPRPANFHSKAFQGQSSGAIYWKLTEGNPPMAAYKSTLTDAQRWGLVAYLRTFGKH